MKKFITKLSVGLATAGIVATFFAPAALAANKVTVKGNGANSINTVTLKNKNTSAVTQTNETAVFTFVLNASNTGDNKIKNSTGGAGDPSITTGDVTNKTNVTVTGSSNTADPIAPCGCATDTTVKVKGNGAGSINTVTVHNNSSSTVDQSNETIVGTAVVNLTNTGGNTISGSTGDGANTISTGDVHNTVNVQVSGGSNTL